MGVSLFSSECFSFGEGWWEFCQGVEGERNWRVEQYERFHLTRGGRGGGFTWGGKQTPRNFKEMNCFEEGGKTTECYSPHQKSFKKRLKRGRGRGGAHVFVGKI